MNFIVEPFENLSSRGCKLKGLCIPKIYPIIPPGP